MDDNMEKNKNGKSVILILLLIVAFLSAAFFFLDSTSAKKEINLLKEKESKKDMEVESYEEQIKNLNAKVESLTEAFEKAKETKKENNDNSNDNKDTNTEENSDVSTETPKPIGRNYEYSVKEIRDLSENSNYKGKKIAFLTFDDGPNHEITPGVLDVLKSKGVHATFFMVGKSIGPDTADIIHRVVDEGHAIATHSFSHDYDYLYPDRNPNPDAVLEEYHKTMKELKAVLGNDFKTRVFRYPGGHLSWNDEGLKLSDKALLDEGVIWIDWNSMNGDAQMESSDNPNEVIRPTNVEEAVHNFDKSLIFTSNPDIAVILMHDASDKHLTLEALPKLIDHLIELGYEFGTLI